jgi:hypothetical protein
MSSARLAGGPITSYVYPGIINTSRHGYHITFIGLTYLFFLGIFGEHLDAGCAGEVGPEGH